ncbi:MAG: MBL fold metallo-hydrolase [Spirochaetes bacterium]|nr:MBL fold metallo-hydrolase [Spirochaetota bacterium]MBU0955936.1 MBL fold metallo-hydrolase [Spirochaetota bacterium]
MRKIIKYFCIFAVLLIILHSCSKKDAKLAIVQLNAELEITEIENNIFLVTHSFPWPGNSLIVLMDKKNILWIDTPYTPEATISVLNWIEKKFGEQSSITEINTGFHIDNLGGNQELAIRNIPIYGSDLTCELLETRSKTTMSNMIGWLNGEKNKKYRDVYSNLSLYKPSITFNINEEQKVLVGSNEVIIYYPGPTHTYDNLVVYIPSQEILFGGCMILSANTEKVGFIEDGNLDEWSKSLTNLQERFDNIRIIVPGHGNPGDSTLIAHTKGIVDASK